MLSTTRTITSVEVAAGDTEEEILEDLLSVFDLLDPTATIFNNSTESLFATLTLEVNYGASGHAVLAGSFSEVLLDDVEILAGSSLPLNLNERVSNLLSYLEGTRPLRHKVAIENKTLNAAFCYILIDGKVER